MVIGFVDASVATYQKVIAVAGVYPDGVIVYVFVDFTQVFNCFSAIITYFIIRICDVDFIQYFGVTFYLIVVVS